MRSESFRNAVAPEVLNSARRGMFTVGAVLALMASQACGDCVLVGVPGIMVTVTDAITKGAPTSVPSLRVTEGSYVEEQPRPPFDKTPPEFAAAAERPGVYAVLIRSDGYQDFVKDGVRVSRSDSQCTSVKQVRITADLIRKL